MPHRRPPGPADRHRVRRGRARAGGRCDPSTLTGNANERQPNWPCWLSETHGTQPVGPEVVASLYLVVRTLASLAANVAVGGHDLIGRALAGWPALSMLA